MSEGGGYWCSWVVPWCDDSECAWRGKPRFFCVFFHFVILRLANLDCIIIIFVIVAHRDEL